MQLALKTINQRVTEVKPFPEDKPGYTFKLEDESILTIGSDSSFVERTIFPSSVSSFPDLKDKVIIDIQYVQTIPSELIDCQYEMTGEQSSRTECSVAMTQASETKPKCIKLKSGEELKFVSDFIKLSLQEGDIYIISLFKLTRYGLIKKFEGFQNLNKAKLKNISGK